MGNATWVASELVTKLLIMCRKNSEPVSVCNDTCSQWWAFSSYVAELSSLRSVISAFQQVLRRSKIFILPFQMQELFYATYKRSLHRWKQEHKNRNPFMFHVPKKSGLDWSHVYTVVCHQQSARPFLVSCVIVFHLIFHHDLFSVSAEVQTSHLFARSRHLI